VTAVSGRDLLGKAVRWRGVRIGAVADLLLDLRGRRVLGLEVVCEDGERRFLPLQAFEPGPRGLEVTSPLVLSDPSTLGFYRERSRSLADMAGSPVLSEGGERASVADVLIDSHGELESLVVRAAGGTRLLPPEAAGPSVRGANGSKS
jgi:hypothetical protein